MMMKVGLTGSIAVGKSFVCSVFRELGCYVLDADQTARDVVRPGTIGLERLVREFGEEILTAEGELDRPKLGKIVFADINKREKLNSIVHPLVIDEQDRWLREVEAAVPDGIAIIDAALMIESGGYKRFDRLIVVWCRPEIQISRLMKRDNIDKDEAYRRIEAQMTQEEKRAFADYEIDTSGSNDETRRRVSEVFDQLRILTR